jgi:hypothetical protein
VVMPPKTGLIMIATQGCVQGFPVARASHARRHAAR